MDIVDLGKGQQVCLKEAVEGVVLGNSCSIKEAEEGVGVSASLNRGLS